MIRVCKWRTFDKILQEQARSGKIVIATIHSPNSKSFALFDHLILMQNGNIIYHGLAKNSTGHFAELGYECSRFSNPADYFMKMLQHIELPEHE